MIAFLFKTLAKYVLPLGIMILLLCSMKSMVKAQVVEGPAGISSGLQLWLTASKGVKDSGSNNASENEAVEMWEDQSTAGRDASRVSSAALYSSDGLNFNPTLLFTDDGYTASDIGLAAAGEDRSIFIVASADAGGWRYVLGTGTFGSGRAFDFGHNSNNQSVFISTHSAQEANTGSWLPYGSARLAYGAVESTLLYIAVNGSENVLGSGGALNTILDGTLNIGSNSNGNEYWSGKISEVIYYTRAVSSLERQRINSYLALKYGFSLDQSTPQSYLASGSAIMWDKDAASASTYNNGLFGIGRDDASGLSQVKSLGQTDTNMIVIEAVDEGTNIQPDFDDIADLEFLVIGDNNGSASWTTTGAPANYSILDRKWFKQEQGDVGTVSLSFNVEDPEMDIPNALGDGQYYFIYDTDNDGSLSDEAPTALTDAGSGIWSNAVNFGAGGLFTLATTDRPAANSLSPLDNSIDIEVNANLVINFSRSVLAGDGNITIYKFSDDSVVQIIPADGMFVSGDGTATITINPQSNFEYYTEYYVLIGTDAFEDGSSNFFPGISAKTSWNFTTVVADSDNDGVNTQEEDLAPNNGDGNNDSILDSEQSNVSSFINSITNKYVTVVVDNNCDLSNVHVDESPSGQIDSSYSYPLGFVSFIADCGTLGFTTEVELYYHDTTLNNAVLRKYNSTTEEYSTLDGIVSGFNPLIVTYSITDGDQLDEDESENGVIVDPIGLGVASESTTLADTGFNPAITITLLLCLTLLGLILRTQIMSNLESSSFKK